MSVALVDNGCGAVNVLEIGDRKAIVGKPDDRTVPDHDFNVVARGRRVAVLHGSLSDRWCRVTTAQDRESRVVDAVTLRPAKPLEKNTIEMHTCWHCVAPLWRNFGKSSAVGSGCRGHSEIWKDTANVPVKIQALCRLLRKADQVLVSMSWQAVAPWMR